MYLEEGHGGLLALDSDFGREVDIIILTKISSGRKKKICV